MVDSATEEIDYRELDDEFFGNFDFGHASDDDYLEYAKKVVREELGEKHVADLDWEHCIIVPYEECWNYV